MLMRPTHESIEDLIELCREINLKKDMVMVELGSYGGESAEVFARFTGKVYCIDEWCPGSMDGILEAENRFDMVCKLYPNIIKVKGLTGKSIPLFYGGAFHFGYIDANHEYDFVKTDLTTLIPKIKKGGYIGGHDYHREYPGVRMAVNELLGGPDRIFKYFSWVKKL